MWNQTRCGCLSTQIQHTHIWHALQERFQLVCANKVIFIPPVIHCCLQPAFFPVLQNVQYSLFIQNLVFPTWDTGVPYDWKRNNFLCVNHWKMWDDYNLFRNWMKLVCQTHHTITVWHQSESNHMMPKRFSKRFSQYLTNWQEWKQWRTSPWYISLPLFAFCVQFDFTAVLLPSLSKLFYFFTHYRIHKYSDCTCMSFSLLISTSKIFDSNFFHSFTPLLPYASHIFVSP